MKLYIDIYTYINIINIYVYTDTSSYIYTHVRIFGYDKVYIQLHLRPRHKANFMTSHNVVTSSYLK